MESSILVSSKKTNAMEKDDSFGRMVENTKAAGCTVSRAESAITATIMA